MQMSSSSARTLVMHAQYRLLLLSLPYRPFLCLQTFYLEVKWAFFLTEKLALVPKNSNTQAGFITMRTYQLHASDVRAW